MTQGEARQLKKTAASIFVECLHANKVGRVFCVPGESFLALLDALRDSPVDVTACRHEAGAGNMALAHAKMTQQTGVVMVTRGPGATHVAIAVHTARQDQLPLVCVIGQVPRAHRDREAFQEVDYGRFFSGQVKGCFQVDRPERIAEYTQKAFNLARAGRPGAVLLVMPEDIQHQLVQVNIPVPTRVFVQHMGDEVARRVMDMLLRAQKPFILAGGPHWSFMAAEHLALLAEKILAPVALSFRCKDYMDNAHSAYVGDLGFAPNPRLVSGLREADVVLLLGTRLSEIETQGYTLLYEKPAHQHIVHVHPSPEEIGHNLQPDLGIAALSLPFMRALLAKAPQKPPQRAAYMRQLRESYEQHVAVQRERKDTSLDLAQIMGIVESMAPTDKIVTNGAGNYALWVHRHLRHRRYPSLLAPQSGAMGFGVPAAVAAALAEPKRTVLCFAGDGCFIMGASELASAAKYGVKVIFIVVNNASYGTIRMHQEKKYPQRVCATDLVNPDFVMLAKAYGFAAQRIESHKAFEAAFARALASEKSYLIELATNVTAITPNASLGGAKTMQLERKKP